MVGGGGSMLSNDTEIPPSRMTQSSCQTAAQPLNPHGACAANSSETQGGKILRKTSDNLDGLVSRLTPPNR